MIVGLFTEVTTVGGIQKVNRHVCASLTAFARAHGWRTLFLAAGRESGRIAMTACNESFVVRGYSRDKLRFLLTALSVSRDEPVFVYVAHINVAPVAWLMARFSPRLRYSVTLHGSGDWNRLPFHKGLALRKADVVMPVSSTLGKIAAKIHGVDRDRIRIVHPSIDPEYLVSSKNTGCELGLPSGRILLTVGRLEHPDQDKGINIDAVIKSMPQVLAAFPDTWYVVVGDGDDRNRLQELASNLGVADKVLFQGVKRGAELLQYYSSCDLLVMPSRREGFGIAFLEAMAFRKPVIGGQYGGAADIIVDGETGFLVPPDNIELLSDKIKTLLGSPDLINNMGSAGYQRLLSYFQYEQFKSRLTQIIDSTINLSI